MNKKLFYVGMYFLLIKSVFAISFKDLLNASFVNNPDILSAQNSYNSAVIDAKSINGNYAPGFLFSGVTTFDENFLDSKPDSLAGSITYSQGLPGGASFTLTGTYSFTAFTMNEERLIKQSQNISFALSQSLHPFWSQGMFHDPNKLTPKLQKQYYFNQFIYTQKSVLQNLLQNYVYTLICNNECHIYRNSISLTEEQLKAERELKLNEKINQARITETENAKLAYWQNLMSSTVSYENYFENLKMICGLDLEYDSLQKDFSQDYLSIYNEVIQFIKNKRDPLEENYKLKIEILQTQRSLQKQNDAPVLTLSIQPNWQSEIINQEKWKDSTIGQDSLTNIRKPQSWDLSVNVNFTPMISGLIKQNTNKYELEYDTVKRSCTTYLEQKNYVLRQYQNLLEQYKKLAHETEKIFKKYQIELIEYETFYESGNITKLDYLSVELKKENCRLTLENLNLNCWLYENLILLNQ